MTDTELGRLAGLLEGEGSFMAGPPSAPNRTRLAMTTTDYDVAERAAAPLGGGPPTSHSRPKQPHHKQAYDVRVRGALGRAWMDRLLPLMSTRRQAQIERALQSFDPGLRYHKTALSMEQADRVRIELEEGRSDSAIGRDFGVSHGVIGYIKRGGYRATQPAVEPSLATNA